MGATFLYLFTFVSPGNKPGFNCSRQAGRLVSETL
jgi:hypothetical protein